MCVLRMFVHGCCIRMHHMLGSSLLAIAEPSVDDDEWGGRPALISMYDLKLMGVH